MVSLVVGVQKTYWRQEIPWTHAVWESMPFPSSQAKWGSGQTHKTSVFGFSIHLWHVSSKYPANRNFVPLNPLNKHKEKTANNMQTIWNKLHFVCSHPDLVWDVVSVDYLQQTPKYVHWSTHQMIFFPPECSASWTLSRFLPKHMRTTLHSRSHLNPFDNRTAYFCFFNYYSYDYTL